MATILLLQAMSIARKLEDSASEGPGGAGESGIAVKDRGTDGGPNHRFVLRWSDQAVGTGLVTLILVLMLAHWIRLSGWGARPIEIDRLLRDRLLRVRAAQAAVTAPACPWTIL